MQIGSCWFDRPNKLFIDHSRDLRWPLNDQEFWVLEQLVLHRGQVVPINQLISLSMTHTSVAKIIESFTRFLGKDHARLLEYIPGQGAVLYKRNMVRASRVLDSPRKSMSYGLYFVMLILTVIAFIYIYIGLSETACIKREYLTFATDLHLIPCSIYANSVTHRIVSIRFLNTEISLS